MDNEKENIIYVKMAEKKTDWAEFLITGLAIIGGTLLFANLFKAFSTPKTVYRCPNCNGVIEKYHQPDCPHCGINLEWDF